MFAPGIAPIDGSTSAADAGPPRLRVALVGTYPVGEEVPVQGGIQSVTRELAHALARRADIECHVVTAATQPQTHHRRVGPLHLHYVRQARRFGSLTTRLFDRPAIARAVRAIAPDIVHGQGQDRHSLGALGAGRPTVVTPHGVLFIENEEFRRSAWDLVGATKIALLNAAEREVFRRADHMVMISRYLPQTCGAMLTAASTFIENPISSRYFQVERRPQPGRLLFAGSLVPRKCVPDLVQAAAHLRDRLDPATGWRLRIAGPFLDAGVERQLRSMVEALRLAPQVEFLGPLGEDALLHEYAQADLLLLASREETSPQVIAQAMACGLPTVAARSGGIPAMVEDGHTGVLFPFGDPVACAEAVAGLLADRARWQRISDRIRREARGRFDADAVAEQTVQVYRQVLQR